MRKQTINKAMLAYEAPALELCAVTENSGFCVSTGEQFVVMDPWDGTGVWE